MPRISRILETSLYVADLDRSERFYAALFGFETVLREDRMVGMVVPGEGVLLLFRHGGSTAASPTPGGVIPPHDAQGSQHLCFAIPVASLDEWVAHLAVSGVALESRVVQTHGGTSLYFRDPDGHSLEVATPATLAELLRDVASAGLIDYIGPVLRFLLPIFMLLPLAARAQEASWAQQQSDACSAAIAAAEQRHGTLPGLLVAIGKAESGRPIPPHPGLQPWPWAVNADGGAYYFDSKAAAVAWTEQALQRGVGQIDVGCMQINLQSHPGAFATVEQAFDPAANADYAARFLLALRADAGGNWYDAVGYYHSHTPELAADYRERVAAIAEGRTPPPGRFVPLYVRAIRQGTLRIPLAGGGVMRINLRRQPSRIGRHLSVCQVAAVLGDFMPARARARCYAVR